MLQEGTSLSVVTELCIYWTQSDMPYTFWGYFSLLKTKSMITFTKVCILRLFSVCMYWTHTNPYIISGHTCYLAFSIKWWASMGSKTESSDINHSRHFNQPLQSFRATGHTGNNPTASSLASPDKWLVCSLPSLHSNHAAHAQQTILIIIASFHFKDEIRVMFLRAQWHQAVVWT